MLRNQPHFRAWLALAAVCFFWGTTYLGIRVALETVPPAMLLCTRFILSGAILISAAAAVKARLPSGRELFYTSLFGIITLGIGNGALVYAEQWVPSGLAAMFVTVGPFWMVGVESMMPGGERLHGPTLAAMLVGLSGTLLLVAPGPGSNGFSGPILKGFIVLQIGCCGWSIGSLLQKRHGTQTNPVVNG